MQRFKIIEDYQPETDEVSTPIKINPKHVNPRDESLFVTSISDSEEDSQITQHSTEEEMHRLLITAQELTQQPWGYLVELVVLMSKEPETLLHYLDPPNWDYGSQHVDGIATALCLLHPDGYQHFREKMKNEMEEKVLIQARKMVVLHQQKMLMDSFHDELKLFHQALRMLPGQQELADSLSNSFTSLQPLPSSSWAPQVPSAPASAPLHSTAPTAPTASTLSSPPATPWKKPESENSTWYWGTGVSLLLIMGAWLWWRGRRLR